VTRGSREVFDELDLKILENIAENPLNIARIAKKIGVSRETVRRRVQRLRKYVQVYALPDYSALGLSLMFVFLDRLTDQDLKYLDSRYLGRVMKFYTENGARWLFVYYFPRNYTKALENHVRKRFEGAIIFEGYNFLRKPSFNLYDSSNNSWKINWNGIAEEILNENKKARLEISPLQKFDEKDLYIINELRANAITTISSIARKLKVNVRSLLYHFHTHVPNLLVGYNISLRPEVFKNHLTVITRIHFFTMSQMLQFAGVLRELPIVNAVATSKEEPDLILSILLPMEHILSFYKFLEKLTIQDFIRNVDFVGIIDIENSTVRPFPHTSDIFNKKWLLEDKFSMSEEVL